ncbi:MAG: hypothetical protein IKH65_09865, partial [Clostridia bacterium]|nr:hypothetical protein [Clostridia bacterium]
MIEFKNVTKKYDNKTTALNECSRMKQLNLNRINAKAPYKVSIDGKQFVFETQYGLHYEIRFF